MMGKGEQDVEIKIPERSVGDESCGRKGGALTSLTMLARLYNLIVIFYSPN